ncbi:MAG: carbohydrate-binding family 9-like protein [Phycisphaerae bacterium]|nr:carbohydrate-binding family 9-like protein [Phycisphaerae bacterium]
MIPPAHVAPVALPRRHYVCYRAPGPAAIDGRLDSRFWSGAPWTEAFVDIRGDAGGVPRHQTRAKLLWDDACLYIGAELEEPHVWATLTEHDSIVYRDNDFELFLSPTGDNHAYYELEINALGTVFDLFLPRPYRDGGAADHDFNFLGLRKAVRIEGTLNDPRDTDAGWAIELAIPWSAFDRHTRTPAPGPPREADVWRLNFSRVQWDLDVVSGGYRKIPDRAEHNWVWSPQGVIDMHRPERWGYLQFSSLVAGSGVTMPRPDPSEAARDALHEIYYAQKAFRHARGGAAAWAARIDELADFLVLTGRGPLLPAPATLVRTEQGWFARQRILTPRGEQEWEIREDSLIRRVR